MATSGRTISARGADHGRRLRLLRADRRAGDPEVGFGAAVAIAIDATIVRLMLVPAAMVLLGERCWWSPTFGGGGGGGGRGGGRGMRSRWGRADGQLC